MSKKDKKKESAKAAKKAAKKETKAALKKAKKAKQEKLAIKSEELAEELRAEREAVLDVDESSAKDVVAVIEQKNSPEPMYMPVDGDKLRTVSIKMPAGLIEAADNAAAAYGGEGISRSEFIRIAIEKLVNE